MCAAVALLHSCDAMLLPVLLQLRPLMSGLLNFLASDPPTIITGVLQLLTHVGAAKGTGVAPKIWSDLWGEGALMQLATITALEVDDNDDDEDEDATNEEDAGDTAVHGDVDVHDDNDSGYGPRSKRQKQTHQDGAEQRSRAKHHQQQQQTSQQQQQKQPTIQQQQQQQQTSQQQQSSHHTVPQQYTPTTNIVTPAVNAAHEMLCMLLTGAKYGLVNSTSSSSLQQSTGFDPAAPEGLLLNPNERRVLRVLQKLQPTECERHAQLLQLVVAAQPLLAVELLGALPYDLEPKATAKRVVAMSLVGVLVRVARGVNLGVIINLTSGGLPPGMESPIFRGIIKACLPPALTKAVLSRGIQHASRLVQYTTLCTLQHCFTALEDVLSAVERLAVGKFISSMQHLVTDPGVHAAYTPNADAVDSTTPGGLSFGKGVNGIQNRGGGDPAWAHSMRRLVALVRGKVPDPSTLVALNAALDKETKHETADVNTGVSQAAAATQDGVKQQLLSSEASAGKKRGKSSAPATSSLLSPSPPSLAAVAATQQPGGSDASGLMRLSVLSVLSSYARWLPDALADSHVDCWKMMPQVRRTGFRVNLCCNPSKTLEAVFRVP